jgi:uncharacterized protein
MKTFSGNFKKIHIIKMETGEDMLETLEKAVSELGIEHGAILEAAGSTRKIHLHVVETNNIPPGNVYFTDPGPWDLLTATGYIMNGRVHAHITLSNEKIALGGHLEPGTEVLTFVIVTIAELEGVDAGDLDSCEK